MNKGGVQMSETELAEWEQVWSFFANIDKVVDWI